MGDEIVSARKERKRKADRYLSEYQRILASYFGCTPDDIQIADFHSDYKHATDLLVPKGLKVAAKTRRPEILTTYPNEFALRHGPNGPFRSEWEKVLDGEADLLLYTYCNPTETHLIGWRLIDLMPLVEAARHDWAGCQRPVETHIDSSDVHLIAFDGKSIEGKYGKLLIASGRLV